MKVYYLGKEFIHYLVAAVFLICIFIYGTHINKQKSNEILELRNQIQTQNLHIEKLQILVNKVEKRPITKVIHRHYVKKVYVKSVQPLPQFDFQQFLLPLPTLPGIQDATSIGLSPPK